MTQLTTGQERALTSDDGTRHTRLRLGLGWDKIPTAGPMGTGAPDVDLDVSAVQFAGDQLFDLAFYNNLSTRDGSVVHLGDHKTGRGDGDDETLTVDLDRVHGPVDTIIFLVSSYHGHSLEWINRAYCRLADQDDTEILRFTLTAGVPQSGLVMASLVREVDGDGKGWKIRAIGQGIDAAIPTESIEALRPFL